MGVFPLSDCFVRYLGLGLSPPDIALETKELMVKTASELSIWCIRTYQYPDGVPLTHTYSVLITKCAPRPTYKFTLMRYVRSTTPPFVSVVRAKCVGRLQSSLPLANEVIAAQLGTVLVAERIESPPYPYGKFSDRAAKPG